MGGSPPVAGAAAAPLPRTRRQAAPAATVTAAPRPHWVAGPSSGAGQSLTAKITIKGAPGARRWRDGASATLDSDLCRQDLGTYQEDGKAEGRAARVRPKQR